MEKESMWKKIWGQKRCFYQERCPDCVGSHEEAESYCWKGWQTGHMTIPKATVRKATLWKSNWFSLSTGIPLSMSFTPTQETHIWIFRISVLVSWTTQRGLSSIVLLWLSSHFCLPDCAPFSVDSLRKQVFKNVCCSTCPPSSESLTNKQMSNNKSRVEHLSGGSEGDRGCSNLPSPGSTKCSIPRSFLLFAPSSCPFLWSPSSSARAHLTSHSCTSDCCSFSVVGHTACRCGDIL